MPHRGQNRADATSRATSLPHRRHQDTTGAESSRHVTEVVAGGVSSATVAAAVTGGETGAESVIRLRAFRELPASRPSVATKV